MKSTESEFRERRGNRMESNKYALFVDLADTKNLTTMISGYPDITIYDQRHIIHGLSGKELVMQSQMDIIVS